MTRAMLAAMMLAVAVPAQAQVPDPDARRSLAGYFMMGGSLLDIDDLNGQLTARLYEPFSDRFFSLGGGLHLIVNQAIIAGELHALLAEQGSVTNGTFTSTLTGGYGSLGVGYLILDGGALDLYPLLGAGWGGMSMELVERGAPTFGEVLDDPARGSRLTNHGPVVSFSLGGDYVFEAGRDAGKGFLIGIRAGYAYAPVEGDWRLGDVDVPAGPAMSVTGPFVRIMLGAGGRAPDPFR